VKWLVLLLQFGLWAQAADPVITASVDREQAHLGDKVILSVNIHFEPGWQFDLEPLGDTLGEATVHTSSWNKPEFIREAGLQKLSLTAELSWFTLGPKRIPPIAFKAGTGQESDQVFESPEIEVQIVSTLEPEDQTPSDSKPQIGMSGLSLWLIAGVILLLVLLIGWVIWRKLRSKDDEADWEPPPLPALEEVNLRLKELVGSSILKEGRTKQFYVEISVIMRHFIGRVFDLPGDEMTSFEIEDRLRAIRTPAGFIDHQSDFNDLCDRVKFAKYEPSEAENTEVVNLAYLQVQALKPLCEEVTDVEVG